MNSLVKFFAGNGAAYQPVPAMSAPTAPAVATEAATPAIAVETLCKKYGTHWAVDEVNFVVPKGWTVGLLGGNGAGKTTTIAMIMGLVVPTVGRAMVLGMQHFSRAELEAAQAAHEQLDIHVLGLASIAADVPPELAAATIASVVVLGAFHASPAVKAALAGRIS